MNTPFLTALRPAPRRSRLARLVVTGLLTTLAGTVGAAGAGIAGASTAGAATATRAASASGYPAMATATYEKRVHYWVNKKREAHGLHRLRGASCTDGVAERWGRYLAENDLFYHQSMQSILAHCDAYYAGETLGRGAISPHRLVRLWMRSPEHRKVLLTRKAGRIGIGAYPDAHGRWVVAADFMRF